MSRTVPGGKTFVDVWSDCSDTIVLVKVGVTRDEPKVERRSCLANYFVLKVSTSLELVSDIDQSLDRR